MAEPIEASLELDLAAAFASLEELSAQITSSLASAGADAVAGLNAELANIQIDPSVTDLSGLTDGLTGASDAAATAADSLGTVSTATGDVETAATNSAEATNGFVDQLFGMSSGAIAGAASLVGLVSIFRSFIDEATAGAAAGQRAQNVFGTFTDEALTVTVGGASQSLTEFAISVGSADEAITESLARFGQLGISAGKSQEEVAGMTDSLVKLATRGIESGKFTDLGQAFDALTAGFARGGKALRDFGIESVTTSAIQAEATKVTGKQAADLTLYEKQVAGITLAERELAGQLDASVSKTRNLADVRRRARQEQLADAREQAGKKLLEPFLRVEEQLTKLAVSAAGVLSGLFGPVLDVVGTIAPVFEVLASGLETVGGVLEPLAPLLKGVLAGFLAFEAINGLVALFGVVQTAFTTFTTAVGVQALSLQAALGPIGLISLAVGAVVAAFSLFSDSGEEAKKVAEDASTAAGSLTDAFLEIGAAGDDATLSAKQMNEALQPLIDSLLEVGPGDIEETTATVNKLGITTRDLQEAVTGTDEEVAAFQKRMAEAAEAAGEWSSGTAKVVVGIETTRDALLLGSKAQIEYAESTGKISEAQAAELRASKLITKARYDAAGAAKELAAAQAEFAEQQGKQVRATLDAGKLQASFTDFVDTIRAGTITDTGIGQFADLIAQDSDKVKAAADVLAEQFDSLRASFASTLPTINDAFGAAATAFSNNAKKLVDALPSDEAKAKATEFLDAFTGAVDPQVLIQKLDEQTAAISNYVANIGKLFDSGFTALAQQAAQQGPIVAAQFAGLPAEIQAQLNTALVNAQAGVASQQQQFEALLPKLGAADIAGFAQTLGLSVEQVLTTAISNGVPGAEAKARELGIKIPGGIAAGAEANAVEAKAAVNATLNSVLDAGDIILQAIGFLASTVTSNTVLPNAFRQLAEESVGQMRTGFIVGFGDLADVITTASGAVGGVAEASGRAIGLAFDRGIASGITGNSGVIADAAVRAALAAERAAKRALGIASPSKVGVEIGEQFGAGLALGIDRSHTMVAASAALLAGQVATPVDASLFGAGNLTNVSATDTGLLAALDRLATKLDGVDASRTVNVDARGVVRLDAREVGDRIVEAIR